MNLPLFVNRIIKKLEDNGFEAFAVGGAVRDLLLGTPPSDFDIATSASPEQVKSLFKRVVDTGIKYKTVTVLTGAEKCEVTQFRHESEYTDFRHPQNVIPAGTIVEDLSRRDFTINAMAYNENQGLIDPFLGKSDIKRGVIKAVGEPNTRFHEDALRIVRAFRFASKLEFDIERETLESALGLSFLIKNVSVERIASEILKALEGKKPSSFAPLIQAGAFSYLGLHKGDINSLDKVENNLQARFAAFCYLCGSDASEIAKNLKLSNQFISGAGKLSTLLNAPLPNGKAEIKGVLKSTSRDLFTLSLKVREALFNEDHSHVLSALKEILENHEPYLLNQLAVNGNDLISAGVERPKIGALLLELLNMIIENPELNQKDYLMDYVTNSRRV